MFPMIRDLRRVCNINNCAQLITDADGERIYLSSKGRNEFICHREMRLGRTSMLTCSSARFSFGSGEWRDGSAARLKC